MRGELSLSGKLAGWLGVALVALGLNLGAPGAPAAAALPVKDPARAGLQAVKGTTSNLIDIESLYAAVKDGDGQGLLLDLSGITSLLDGTRVDPGKIYGTIYVGPYPMEARQTDYDMRRWRRQSAIEHGKGHLDLAYLLKAPHNSEGWTDSGVVALRVSLALATPGPDRQLGVYDTLVRFRKTGNVFTKQPTIIEGPRVNLVRSDDYGRLVIAFTTGEAVAGKVRLSDGREFADAGPTRRHEIAVTGLKPQKTYRYRVALADWQTRWYTIHTAPRPGAGSVTFAYLGDSRGGVGGGENDFMGLNLEALKYAFRLAYRKGAALALMAGDLANGYTTSPEDFRTQLYAWKEAAGDFWHERPIYVGIGNHESLLKKFSGGSPGSLEMDNWPYAEASSEAVFGQEFVNPANGPAPADARRPPYKGNVYSFQYGPVKFIAFNNTYWLSWFRDSWEGVKQYGGCPEGYILPDQLDWIKREVAKAEKDPTVKYIILFAHEPVLPNAAHVTDSMWYGGNNRVRAYAVNGQGAAAPVGPGIIDVRNGLIRLVCRSKKVAAVLTSHEHSYHRTLVTKQVPLGDPAKDGANAEGRICGPEGACSPLPDLTYPTWFITSGGAGAPYYSEMPTPWNRYWRQRAGKGRSPGYWFSSQENLVIFKADGKRISMAVYNASGQEIDRIDNLMAVKKRGD